MKKIWGILLIGFITFAVGVTIFNIQNKNINKGKETLKDTPIVENKNNDIYRGKNLIYNESSIPVLMYHSIDYEKGNELRVPLKNFEEQMQYLKEAGFTTLTLEELYNFFTNNKPIPEKSVVITFDDGYQDNYTNAYPVIKKYGLKATVFVITSTIDKNAKCLNSSELKEMESNGFNVESHTVNHEELAGLSFEKQLETLNKSKTDLENILNKKVYYLAYPVGKWDNNSIEALKTAGYRMAFTTKNAKSNKSNGIYTLNRVRINASCSIDQFKSLLK
ncbi:MAG: polysaccharide deacetylase family protein [Solirubrobacterales bacterium]